MIGRIDALRLARTLVAAAFLAALLTASCGGDADDEEDRPVSAPPRVTIENGETVVALDAPTLGRSGLELDSLPATSHAAVVNAYGSVVDLAGLARLRGELGETTASVARTQAVLTAARAELARTQALRADGAAASQKALEAATAAVRTGEADAHAATAALASLEAEARQQWGDVIASWLADGSPRLEALLAGRERLVQLTVPDGASRPPAPLTAVVRAGEAGGVTARLVSPAPRVDARLQGESLYYAVPARPELLIGATVAAELTVGATAAGVVVPASAVVWWQGKAWVYVEVAPGRFARREISTDAPSVGGWFTRTGPTAGQRVVVQGAQMLLSEEGRASVHGSEG